MSDGVQDADDDGENAGDQSQNVVSTEGERQRSKTIQAIKRLSQTRNVNVGMGRKGSFARMARTLGL